MENKEEKEDFVEEEGELDDNYLLQLHQILQDMKQRRKKAEADAQLLDGRLNCLRNEEKKVEGKIKVARRKKEQKKIALEEQEKEMKFKIEFKKRKEEELQKKKEQNQEFKLNHEAAKLKKRQELQRQREEDLKNLKEQKKVNEELKKCLEEEDYSNKRTQAEYIKSQHNIAEEKKKAIELEKKNKIKLELESKIREEQERIQLAEEKKQYLENEENEIMIRLKTTTQIHEGLVKDYENLGSGKK